MIPLSDRIPTRRFPIVTILLILVNVLVFAWEMLQLNTGGDVALQQTFLNYGVVPGRVAVEPLSITLLTFVTSMFLHASLLHIGGNMLYLWIFGNNIEDVLGHTASVGGDRARAMVRSAACQRLPVGRPDPVGRGRFLCSYRRLCCRSDPGSALARPGARGGRPHSLITANSTCLLSSHRKETICHGTHSRVGAGASLPSL
jgi:hypothetical protein